MLRSSFLLLALFASRLPAVDHPVADYPSVTLANDVGLEALVYLPDPEAGYYRGTRMDHAGMVGELRWRGHVVFAPWRKRHDPTSPDHAIGLAGEFDMDGPQQFATVAPGEAFLKIGVGKLIRPTAGERAETYFFNHRYQWAEAPTWNVAPSEDGRSVAMHQALTLGDHGYEYTCSVALEADAPVVVITHHLRNTGQVPLRTEHYSHHFFSFDGAPVGPGYALTTPFVPRWEAERANRFEPVAELDDHSLRFIAEIERGAVYTAFDTAATVAHNAFTIRGPAGLSVHYRGDRPVARWQLYAERHAMCPEPFIRLEIAPGDLATSTRRYRLTFD